jgi:hypothetical protein
MYKIADQLAISSLGSLDGLAVHVRYQLWPGRDANLGVAVDESASCILRSAH